MGHNSGRWARYSEFVPALTSEGMRHESVGWVFFEDDVSVALCLSRGMEAADEDDPNVCDVMQIPKVAITSRTLLEPKKGTRR